MSSVVPVCPEKNKISALIHVYPENFLNIRKTVAMVSSTMNCLNAWNFIVILYSIPNIFFRYVISSHIESLFLIRRVFISKAGALWVYDALLLLLDTRTI